MQFITHKQINTLVGALDGANPPNTALTENEQQFLEVAREVSLGVASAINNRRSLTLGDYNQLVQEQLQRVGRHYVIEQDERARIAKTLERIFDRVASSDLTLYRN